MSKGKSRKWLWVALLSLFVAGSALALPPRGYRVAYYGSQGQLIGLRERTCGGYWIYWGSYSGKRINESYSCDEPW